MMQARTRHRARSCSRAIGPCCPPGSHRLPPGHHRALPSSWRPWSVEYDVSGVVCCGMGGGRWGAFAELGAFGAGLRFEMKVGVGALGAGSQAKVGVAVLSWGGGWSFKADSLLS